MKFPKTAAALATYDRLDLLVDAAPNETALDAMEEWEAARVKVAEAFADETAAYNDRQTVLGHVGCGAGLAFVRRMVAMSGTVAA